MRGHVGYWDAKKKDLRAHVAIFGPPTFFLTLNPAEKRWEEVLDLYQEVRGLMQMKMLIKTVPRCMEPVE